MKTVLFFLALAVLWFPPVAFSQMHEHHHDDAEQLGDVSFPIGCNETVQKDFNRALALLHSFWYAEALKAFQSVAEADPKCAMAQWGIAMSNYHPIWTPPVPNELQQGKAAVEKAMQIGSQDTKEKELIEAIQVFYHDSDKIEHPVRAKSYAQAMEAVYNHFPDDVEVAAFYGLSLLGTVDAKDKTYAVQKKAAEVLNKLVERAPRHPGVAHYIIHSFDYPALAELALPAARAYAKIAPSAPHALHMPSHIFTRLGLWEESIQSNLASAAAAKKHAEKIRPGSGSFDQLHAIDYLVYAYLQTGKDQEAKKVHDEIFSIPKLDLDNFAAAYAFGAVPARLTLEKQNWREAAKLTVKPTWFPWEKFAYAEANIHFARAVGAARCGEMKTAEEAEQKLISLRDGLKDKYWWDQVEILRLQAGAWILYAKKENEKAVEMMRAAATLEDSTEKHAVTPGLVIPSHEALGQLYLELKKPAEALAEFDLSLKTAPNRKNSFLGAEQAAKMAGNQKAAEEYAAKVKSLK